MEIQTFELSLGGSDRQRIHRKTREQAIFAFENMLDDIDFYYLPEHIECRALGFIADDRDFIRTAKYRDVPYARIGMRVSVGDRVGWLVGSNSSANFDVLFESRVTGVKGGYQFMFEEQLVKPYTLFGLFKSPKALLIEFIEKGKFDYIQDEYYKRLTSEEIIEIINKAKLVFPTPDRIY